MKNHALATQKPTPLGRLAHAVAVGLLALLASACGSDEPPCGGSGEACCAAASACDSGLGCSAGTCQAAPFAGGLACKDNSECASTLCNAGLCLASTCEDKVRNGTESDIDCGGDCSTGCGLGAKCTASTDCARGSCLEGLCGFAPAALVGPGGGPESVVWTEIANEADGLVWPSDLAFNLDHPDQLWIVDRENDALLVVKAPGSSTTSKRLILDDSEHFLEEVVAISFDGAGTFATCGDNRNSYGGQAAPNDFMGPAQWSSDVDYYPEGESAHLYHWDMLHSSPRCLGIAAAGGPDEYYCVNGQIGAIDWYDFNEPHEPGGDDHKDGEKHRYADPNFKIARVAGVPANIERDPATNVLYIADPGNGRVLRLDPNGATKGKLLTSFFEDGKLYQMSGFTLGEFTGAPLSQPSGLALHQGTLYVADRGTGLIHAYSLAGEALRTLDSGLGAGRLAGMTAGTDDLLYVIDSQGKRVLRVEVGW